MIRNLIRKARGERRQLNETEFEIYLDFIAHPHYMPTEEELSYFNPPKSDEEISEALTALMQGGMIQPVEATNPNGGYVTFYGLTEYGAEQAENAVTSIERLREQFENVEGTERTRELEQLPRPPTKEVAGVEIPDESALDSSSCQK